jgi:hypothetical protein
LEQSTGSVGAHVVPPLWATPFHQFFKANPRLQNGVHMTIEGFRVSVAASAVVFTNRQIATPLISGHENTLPMTSPTLCGSRSKIVNDWSYGRSAVAICRPSNGRR